MPSTSDAQKRLMAAVAHAPKFAKKVGVPVMVAKEFNSEDQRALADALRKRHDKKRKP